MAFRALDGIHEELTVIWIRRTQTEINQVHSIFFGPGESAQDYVHTGSQLTIENFDGI